MRQLKIFHRKKVIITGHTGFKGSWLSLWLSMSGAKVMGISNKILTNPSNYRAINLKKNITSKKIDIRNLNHVKKTILDFKPDYIFHLAAQSLVKMSYLNPIYTYETNTIGTLNILESIRFLKNRCNIVLITSDKSYKNLEIKRGYRETDRLGGIDPYSSSKASAELIIQTYVNTFLKNKKNIRIAIARAGNVVGGGDWSLNRLIPDCVKSWSKNQKVLIRSPKATRPWQHVLEALSGYIILSYKLSKERKLNGEVFNFGPSNKKDFTVIDVIQNMKKDWKKVSWKLIKRNKFHHESNLLKLNCSKAKKFLNWKSVLSFNETIRLVSTWYKNYYEKRTDIKKISIQQIKYFEKIFKQRI